MPTVPTVPTDPNRRRPNLSYSAAQPSQRLEDALADEAPALDGQVNAVGHPVDDLLAAGVAPAVEPLTGLIR